MAYKENNFDLTITHMERSLKMFLDEYQNCRYLCESPFDQGWFPDFVSSVAKGETRKACEAVATFLHLNPNDEVQNRNKEFYDSVDEVTQDMYVPRKEVVALKEREDYEQQLMAFIETNFAFLTDELWHEDDPKSEISKEVPSFRSRVVSQLKSLSELGVKAVKGEWEKDKQDRLVADGLTSTLECMVLTELIRFGAVEGDGYKGSYSPHTNAEAFQGISLGRAGLQLYFAYTHLVCRTAKPEMNHNRSALDLSHEVHADNCILQNSGECLRVPPAYTYRDYSAILYLNDDFEGGEFIFTQDMSGLTYESSVNPQCGRLVGFSSGPENSHGVLPVRKGTRCSIGMWFTHDRKHNEVERSIASLFLKQLNAKQI
ncbi:Prolyl 3-hydroxylase 1 [Portunus trituberculatus]|uniref:procollagen-proline 3-dioxygenase n=1 Tax=Portunus trituberculatus TaxID=210409 RepID=A0A5B7E258_PORTR|nr:Prolyl 3-hydroxylase 1 [Portunus trituberculatus]